MISDPILVVDDAQDIRSAITSTLTSSGYSVESAVTGNEALEKLRNGKFSMIITDAGIPECVGPECAGPECSGMDVLVNVKRVSPRTPVIMTTSSGSVGNAVEAMQAGASDYILKPFSSETLKTAVRKVHADIERYCRVDVAADHPLGRSESKRMITRNPEMIKILALATNVASSRATVLILGESGTGKEVLAAFIHHHSNRNHKALVAINCAALPDTLAESELFGHERGAFTGAFSRKAGKFELAHDGTLLLDEISEMSMPLQAKLLRVLQEQEIDRIGGTRPVPVDTRIIAVSNVDLKKAVGEGTFREDLFYRINVVPLKMPPLRDRKDDIPLLAEFFLEKYSALNGRSMSRISDDAAVLLADCEWRGNVRELENIIERAVLLGDGDVLMPEHLMLEPKESDQYQGVAIRAGMSVREMEKKLIFHTLNEVNDNRTQAAELLGVSIRTLRNKLKEYRENMAG